MVRLDTETEPVRTTRSALVGRDGHLTTLEDIIARAIEFQVPQLVTVVGNQGTGKTRLINELISRLANDPKRSCRVYHGAAERDAAHQPVRLAALTSLLRDRFELTPDPDDVTRLRFTHEIKTVMGAEQVTEMQYFLGSFVGLEFPTTAFLRSVAENPKHRTELARTALRRFIEEDASQHPLVIVLDDMQWADTETLAVVSDLAASLAGSQVVLLTAARPKLLVHAGGWGEGAVEHERIDLRNLEPDDAEQMFKNL
ncbi:MAG: AAA family ATPase, partial [Kofleriaceae bacterium]